MNVLIIKSKRDSFEAYINNKIIEKKISLITLEDILPNSKQGVIKRISVVFNILAINYKYHLRKFDKIIVFENTLVSLIIGLLTRKKKTILWLWNTIDSRKERYISLLNKINNILAVWTFDQEDSFKYHLRHNTQFYFFEDIDSGVYNHELNSIFFVGRDKGRISKLKEIYEIALENDMICNFYVVPDKKTDNLDDMGFPITMHGLEYSDTIRNIENCKVVLDLCKEGQKGMTVRVLEAVSYKKKIITNNDSLYNDKRFKNNVFILGIDDVNQINDFLARKFEDYDAELLKYYSFDSWLDRFFCEQ